VVSTHLKNISQNGSFPQVEVKIKKIETTTQISMEPKNGGLEDDFVLFDWVIL